MEVIAQQKPPCALGCEFKQFCKTAPASCNTFDVFIQTGVCYFREGDDTPTQKKYQQQFAKDRSQDGRSVESKQVARFMVHKGMTTVEGVYQ